MINIIGLGLFLVMLSFGIGILAVHGMPTLRKSRTLHSALPNCPFILYTAFGGNTYVTMQGHRFEIELQRGVRPNGLYGVVKVYLRDSGKMRDGTDVVKLHKDLKKFISYVEGLGLEFYDGHGVVKELDKAMQSIDPLAYLDTEQSQKDNK